MTHRFLTAALLAAAVYLLYFHGLATVGLVSVDEPRYAAIGRAMAESGDWVTPRLWGVPWFEKPPLLYWLIAAATTAGLRNEWAVRLPIAALSVAFLLFYWRILRQKTGITAANWSTALLGTSAGWLAYSSIGVTDLPLAATFAPALLLAMPSSGAGPRPAAAPWAASALAGAFLGAAVLAKALVPIALAVPAIWWWRRNPRNLVITAATAVAIAAPWYVLCYTRNGKEFLEVLIIQHHFARFFQAQSQVLHPGPWWFYAPVLLSGLLPGTPILTTLARKEIWQDPAVRYCAAIFAFGFLFLSASEGKLPGYLLPLLPFLTAATGIAAARTHPPRWALAASMGFAIALCTGLPPLIPGAYEYGLGKADLGIAGGALAAGAAAAALTWFLGTRVSPAVLLAIAILSMATLKHRAAGLLEEHASARREWQRVESEIDGREVCQNWLRRTWLYGFNYYRGQEIPACADPPDEAILRIESDETTGRAVVRLGPTQ